MGLPLTCFQELVAQCCCCCFLLRKTKVLKGSKMFQKRPFWQKSDFEDMPPFIQMKVCVRSSRAISEKYRGGKQCLRGVHCLHPIRTRRCYFHSVSFQKVSRNNNNQEFSTNNFGKLRTIQSKYDCFQGNCATQISPLLSARCRKFYYQISPIAKVQAVCPQRFGN